MVAGGFIAALAFVVSAGVQLKVNVSQTSFMEFLCPLRSKFGALSKDFFYKTIYSNALYIT
jgi:hypothetical protein